MNHHGPSPSWLRLPYPTDEHNCDDNQVDGVKQEKSTNSVSPLPPITQYLNTAGEIFIQFTNHKDNEFEDNIAEKS